jgi:hypothetical protein
MSLFNRPDYRLIVSLGGGVYCGSTASEVVFKDPQDGHTMKLWRFACKSPDDVKAALKSHREQVKDFSQWEPVER